MPESPNFPMFSDPIIIGPASGLSMRFDEDGNEVWTSWRELEVGGEVFTKTWVQRCRHPVPSVPCRVYWGSHGCQLERGHVGHCECNCCECEDHELFRVRGCVGKYPYYGPDTGFCGEDVDRYGLPHLKGDDD